PKGLGMARIATGETDFLTNLAIYMERRRAPSEADAVVEPNPSGSYSRASPSRSRLVARLARRRGGAFEVPLPPTVPPRDGRDAEVVRRSTQAGMGCATAAYSPGSRARHCTRVRLPESRDL